MFTLYEIIYFFMLIGSFIMKKSIIILSNHYGYFFHDTCMTSKENGNIQNEDIVVLIDWENLDIHCYKERKEQVNLEVLLDYVRSLGRVRHVLAFAGFVIDNSAKLVEKLHHYGIEPRFTMTRQNLNTGAIKNAADIHLAVTAMQLAHTSKGIRGITIVSGDQGFLPLVRELKMNGLTVHILSMDKERTIKQLAKEADTIEYYDELIH